MSRELYIILITISLNTFDTMIMGHSEGKGTMTATYTDWKPEMFPEVYEEQEELFKLLKLT